MANIALPYTFAPATQAKSAEVNSNFTEIRDKFNTYAVQTDVAKTITVAHTLAANLLFTDALYDIGQSGATRPRDGFFSRNLTVGGTTALQALSASTGAFSSTVTATQGILDEASANATLTLKHAGTAYGYVGITAAANYIAGAASRALFLRSDAIEIDFSANTGSSIQMRLTSGGILNLGTTVIAGAAAGESVLAYSKAHRSVDQAGTGTKRMIYHDTFGGFTNTLVLGIDATEIAIGRATIALGGGAAPTLGTIGGTGPAAAAQTAWFKFIDNGGTARYVPFWT